jgi:hypothetical protein
MMNMQYADVDVEDEQIVVHPTCSRDHGKIWTGEAHVFGVVIINGEKYQFDRFIDVEFEKTKEKGKC